MSNDDRWNDHAMNDDDQYQEQDSYHQADYGASQAAHHDAAIEDQGHQDYQDGHQGPGDLAPRESRKERRRRLAMEQFGQPEEEFFAQPEVIAQEVSQPQPQPQNEQDVVEEPKASRFGFLKKKSARTSQAAQEPAQAVVEAIAEPVADGESQQIRLPMNATIDPAMLAEYGLDPNTLVSMGLDPSTLPQFDEDFLKELGINPNIVIDILNRQAAALAVVSKGGFDTSMAAWRRRVAIVKRWAPAAAALTGLSATGAIWFMAGGEAPKTVPVVQANADERADSASIGQADVAKLDQAAKPVGGGEASEPTTAEALPLAEAGPPTESMDAPGGGEALPSASLADAAPVAPIAIAAAEPPGLPPMIPSDEKNKGSAPAASGLPDLPGMGEAPPLPNANAQGTEKIADTKPSGLDSPTEPKAHEKNSLLPPIAGLGAAALAADALAAPKLPDVPSIAEKPLAGLESPTDLPPLGNLSANAAPGLDVKPPEPPKSVADAAPAKPEMKGPPTAPVVAPPAAPPVAVSAGIAAGIGAGLGVANIVAKEDAKSAVVKPGAELTGLSAEIAAKNSTAPVKAGEAAPELPKTLDIAKNAEATAAPKPVELPKSGPEKILSESPDQKSIADVIKARPEAAQAAELPHAGLPVAKADWPTIPNGRGRVLRSIAGTSSSGSQSMATAGLAGAGLAAAGIASRADRSSTSAFDVSQNSPNTEIAPIKHTVQSGENFWTISRDYYGSGRYYKSLWAANRSEVAKIDQLHVGESIRIPAMEYLDKSLIETVGVAKGKTSANRSTDGNSGEVARSLDRGAVRTGNEIESKPTGQEPPASKPKISRTPAEEQPSNDKEIISQPLGDMAAKVNYPRHRVQPGDTLRTIARERLGDQRRDKEIVALNPDILESTRTPLVPGQVLKLPIGSQND